MLNCLFFICCNIILLLTAPYSALYLEILLNRAVKYLPKFSYLLLILFARISSAIQEFHQLMYTIQRIGATSLGHGGHGWSFTRLGPS